jgi:hypothetical protein
MRGEEAHGHTWFDIAYGLLSVGDLTASEGFGVTLADILRLGLRWDVSLDYARGDSETCHLLSDGLAKAGGILWFWEDVSVVEVKTGRGKLTVVIAAVTVVIVNSSKGVALRPFCLFVWKDGHAFRMRGPGKGSHAADVLVGQGSTPFLRWERRVVIDVVF